MIVSEICRQRNDLYCSSKTVRNFDTMERIVSGGRFILRIFVLILRTIIFEDAFKLIRDNAIEVSLSLRTS